MFLLENPTRSYEWGSRTVIAGLLGRAASENPQAELWIGAHPDSPSDIVDATTDLLTRLRADPRGLLGERAHDTFGDRLPYLLKVLAVERPLSLQVHPDEKDALAGFDAEAAGSSAVRLFKDPHHKPELLYAVSEFRALCGFRPVPEARALFERLERHAPGVRPIARIARLLDDPEPAIALRRVCEYVAALPPDETASLIELLPVVAEQTPDESLRVAARLADEYAKDAAVLLCVLLRHVVLQPGEVIGVEPGTPHTYLGGAAVELTTCSDNTIRAGLTYKPTDIERFVDVLVFEETDGTGALRTEQRNAAERTFTTGHSEFELSVLSLSPGMSVRWSPKPRTVLVLKGQLTLTVAGGSATVHRGGSVFVPANAGPVDLDGDGRAVQATTGL